MSCLNIQPLEGENFDEYKFRVYELKNELKLTYEEISNMLFANFKVRKSSESVRKDYKNNFCKKSQENALEILSSVGTEKQNLMDMYSNILSVDRRVNREQSIIDIASLVADKMNTNYPFVFTSDEEYTCNSDNELIVVLSDWHYGIEFTNYFNSFSIDICKERINKLLHEIKVFIEKNPVKKIHCCNLGDLIAGRIHYRIRLSSRIDVVSQCLEVAEILAQFLFGLQEFAPVAYYDCLDNHSRLEPSKEFSLTLESLVRVIPRILELRLKDTKVTIHSNEISEDIIQFTALDGKYNIAAVHGHKDKHKNLAKNISAFTKNNYDLILTSHEHHFYANEENETVVIGNGSLMGTDDYALDLRVGAKPSQNVILLTQKSPCEVINRIVL